MDQQVPAIHRKEVSSAQLQGWVTTVTATDMVLDVREPDPSSNITLTLPSKADAEPLRSRED